MMIKDMSNIIDATIKFNDLHYLEIRIQASTICAQSIAQGIQSIINMIPEGAELNIFSARSCNQLEQIKNSASNGAKKSDIVEELNKLLKQCQICDIFGRCQRYDRINELANGIGKIAIIIDMTGEKSI